MIRKNNKAVIAVVGGIAVVSIVVFGLFALARNVLVPENVRNAEDAMTSLTRMVGRIDPSTAKPVKSSVEYSNQEDTTADELPELDSNKVTAEATTDLHAEIWCSPEKAGSGTDGWMRELAERFNEAGYEVDGQRVSVRIRNVSSGLGNDYILTGKATPDGYTPSSRLWVDMLSAKGIACDFVRERTVGNVAGFLVDKEHYDKLVKEYGQADLKAVTEAVGAGELTMGYTNPFTSSTGLNFLVSTLLRYDRDDPLSDTAAEGFRKFQANVPFVALTTVQMRDAAERGSLDGFVLEYQLYANDPSLSKAYKFVPFGYRHDNRWWSCPRPPRPSARSSSCSPPTATRTAPSLPRAMASMAWTPTRARTPRSTATAWSAPRGSTRTTRTTASRWWRCSWPTSRGRWTASPFAPSRSRSSTACATSGAATT